MAKNKARSFKGFPAAKRKQLEQQDEEILERARTEQILLPGQGGTELEEPMVKYEPTEVEVVLPRKATHWGRHRIVFGRDRHTREGLSGYGGRGCTAAGSIDIVVGSGGPEPEHGLAVGPNFFTDAARIYLTQRGDIDAYFDLPADIPNAIQPAENRSAIAAKADGIRIIGREGVRIYTNPRTKNSGKQKETNAVGGDIQSKSGIHLIANMESGPVEQAGFATTSGMPAGQLSKYNKIQPLVKGDFLIGFLTELMEDIEALSNALTAFAQYQLEFNTRIGAHTHTVAGPVPGVAIPDISSLLPATIKVIQGQLKDTIIKGALNHANMKIVTNYNWLKPTSPIFILSKYNKTN
tara:strand:- start:346 stop:1401 length:1056 start_codon:yes stop_codon:yes gene_type:complete